MAAHANPKTTFAVAYEEIASDPRNKSEVTQ